VDIRIDDLSGPAVVRLLQEHRVEMFLHSPPGSVHALDLEALRHPSMTVWAVWKGEELMGCGALKALDGTHGEVKSMRTAARFQRNGVATALMRHILREARARGYRRLSLETGTPDAFAPARALYERFGFEECGPFGDYAEDPYSVFMTLAL
jgi:putative acetyltransferase